MVLVISVTGGVVMIYRSNANLWPPIPNSELMIHSSIGEPLILSNYLDTSTVKLIRAFLFSSNRFFGNLCSTTTIQRYAPGPDHRCRWSGSQNSTTKVCTYIERLSVVGSYLELRGSRAMVALLLPIAPKLCAELCSLLSTQSISRERAAKTVSHF